MKNKKILILSGFAALAIVILTGFLFAYILLNKNVNTQINDISLKGNGTILNPYKISSEEDLRNLSELVSAGNDFEGEYILQTDNIDLSDDVDYLPIGIKGKSFNGNYNGAGYLINNVNINRSYASLFYNMYGTLRNITIGSGLIEGDIVAPFAIQSKDREAQIINCYNYASLKGAKKAAGIAYNMENGSIIFCQNYGPILSDDYYSFCAKQAKNVIASYTDYLRLPDDYRGYLYCLHSSLEEQLRVINSYMSLTSTKMCPNVRTELIDNHFVLSSKPIKKGRIEGINGNGSKINNYKIYNAEDFILFKDLVNSGIDFSQKQWEQKCDIDLAEYGEVDPIGIFDSEHYFWGKYNGNGYLISHLNMIRNDNCGLFGQLAGTVLNVQLVDGYIEGANIGSIASHSAPFSSPQIINCYSNVTLHGVDRTGGLVDNFGGGTVILSLYEGNIENTEGFSLCSYDSGRIINSYAINNAGIPLINKSTYGGELININSGKNAVESMNNYIDENVLIRGINHRNLCKWDAISNHLTTEKGVIFLNITSIICTILFGILLYATTRKNSVERIKGLISKAKTIRVKDHRNILILVIYVMFVFFVIVNYFLDWEGYKNLFFYAIRNAFSDKSYMLNVTLSQSSERYTLVPTFYPPLANIIYWLPTLLYGDDFAQRLSYLSIDIDKYNIVQMMCLLFFIITIIASHRLIEKSFNDSNKIRKLLVGYSFLFMVPVLYALERGNNVWLAAVLTIAFYKYYEDKRKAIAEMAIICLALATSLKIYPLVFVVFLINLADKSRIINSIKKISRFIIYTMLINFFAVISYGGIEIVPKYIKNLMDGHGRTSLQELCFDETGIDFFNLFRLVFDTKTATNIRYIFILISLLSIMLALISNAKKHELAILVCICICMAPSQSYIYVLCFFIIPLIQMYNERTLNGIEYVEYGALLIIMALCPHFFVSLDFKIFGILSSVVMIFLMYAINIRAIYCIWNKCLIKKGEKG